MTHEVVRIASGAWAVRDTVTGEVMHPGVGPLREAHELYVRQSQLQTRLLSNDPSALTLFDVGLGAGSNARAAWALSQGLPHNARSLRLISFECDLGALQVAVQTGAPFGWEGENAIAANAILANGQHQSPRGSWCLRKGDVLENLSVEPTRADIVFWDPFSPRANPDLWTVAAFRTLRQVAGPVCTVFTYSASTATRVALLLAGWAVGVGDAIGDKATTTAAAVQTADLARPLDKAWLSRVRRPEVPLPKDAPPDAVDRVCESPQFR